MIKGKNRCAGIGKGIGAKIHAPSVDCSPAKHWVNSKAGGRYVSRGQAAYEKTIRVKKSYKHFVDHHLYSSDRTIMVNSRYSK
ncbi:MAG: hypothetical protein ACKVOQ_04795 [Cyclobacteriaceae bacterium]